MTLSVIIVNYNVKYYLGQCLESVFASELGENELEVIVMDNASEDGSEAYIKSRFPQVKYIFNKDNLGFSRANNNGIVLSKGEYVLLLNPDTVVGEHVLGNACQFMNEHPKAGALGVKMVNRDGVFLPESKRGYPSLWISFCKFSGLCKRFSKSRFFNGYYLGYLDENRIHQVPVLAGAFMLLRRETLNEVGVLDERFFMFGEDIDLSVRIGKAGWEIYYVPELIMHYKGESCRKNKSLYVQQFYDAMVLFYKKHYGKKQLTMIPIVWFGAQVGKMISRLKWLLPQKEEGSSLLNKQKEERFEDIIEQLTVKK
ncbi:MAG: glycosyltransferase family 2 protein [Paludibacteraceae bacterium]|nr:glycosyltransferase family 2 protein [Paludibacteraceae bacterium]